MEPRRSGKHWDFRVSSGGDELPLLSEVDDDVPNRHGVASAGSPDDIPQDVARDSLVRDDEHAVALGRASHRKLLSSRRPGRARTAGTRRGAATRTRSASTATLRATTEPSTKSEARPSGSHQLPMS